MRFNNYNEYLRGVEYFSSSGYMTSVSAKDEIFDAMKEYEYRTNMPETLIKRRCTDHNSNLFERTGCRQVYIPSPLATYPIISQPLIHKESTSYNPKLLLLL